MKKEEIKVTDNRFNIDQILAGIIEKKPKEEEDKQIIEQSKE